MQEIIDFIKENSGVFIFIVALITLLITLTKLFPKRPKLKITGYSRYSGLNATEPRGNDNPKDNRLNDDSNASRDMISKITLSIRNTSKKRAFNVRIKELNNKLRVRKNLPEDFSIEPDSETTIELEYTKKHFGKYRNIKNTEFYKNIDISKDFSKKETVIKLAYENSKGKEFSVTHYLSKNGNKN